MRHRYVEAIEHSAACAVVACADGWIPPDTADEDGEYWMIVNNWDWKMLSEYKVIKGVRYKGAWRLYPSTEADPVYGEVFLVKSNFD